MQPMGELFMYLCMGRQRLVLYCTTYSRMKVLHCRMAAFGAVQERLTNCIAFSFKVGLIAYDRLANEDNASSPAQRLETIMWCATKLINYLY